MPYNYDQAIDGQNPELLALRSPYLLRKKKTCPLCRAVVPDRPFEAWGLKSITEQLRSSGLFKEFDNLPSPIHLPPADGQTRTDPWDGIFSKVNSGMDSAVARLIQDELNFVSSLNPARGSAPPARAHPGYFFDEEDDVNRCSGCAYEIVQACCVGCGRVFPQLINDGDSHDDNSDTTSLTDVQQAWNFWNDSDSVGFDIELDDDDAEEDENSDDDSPGWPSFEWTLERVDTGVEGAREAIMEEEDDGYESSFIDDEDAGVANDMLAENSASDTETIDDENVCIRSAKLILTHFFLFLSSSLGYFSLSVTCSNSDSERSAVLDPHLSLEQVAILVGLLWKAVTMITVSTMKTMNKMLRMIRMHIPTFQIIFCELPMIATKMKKP